MPCCVWLNGEHKYDDMEGLASMYKFLFHFCHTPRCSNELHSAACWKALSSAPVAYPGIFFWGRGGGSTNSVEDRGQRTEIWGW
jgi:hypothetical protein